MDIYLSRLMVYALQIEEEKHKERERENKRARTGSFNFSQPRPERGDHSQFHQKFLSLTPTSTSAPVPMFRVFKQYLDMFLIVFIDDIFVNSCNENDRTNHLRVMLHTLRDYQLFTKIRKDNVVTNAPSRLSMGSIAHVEGDKNKLVRAPSNLLCREIENNRILEFYKQAMEQEKAGSLNICGCPGTKKSLSMEKVNKVLVNWAENALKGMLDRTNWFDAPLKFALLFALPALFGIWLGLSIAGSVFVGVGYGFCAPWVFAFEAFRHDVEFNKFVHGIMDGTWGTIKGCYAYGSEVYTGNVNLRKRESSHSRRKIIIGSSIGASALLLATIVSCILMQKGKKTSLKERFVSSLGDPAAEAAHCFTLAELERATKDFEKKVGSGGFGVVYYGKLKDGKEIAVKVLKNNSLQVKREFSNEVALLSRIHHRNLIQFLGFCLEDEKSILVYQFMHNGNLKKHLYDSVSLANTHRQLWDCILAQKVSHQCPYVIRHFQNMISVTFVQYSQSNQSHSRANVTKGQIM
ncbi:putative LRR receptor-like serine/threonine-protein kinase [Capsicum chinense]|nr:putative LRR receptor-like serine/threonine-protein kinase [Capsicum chinense]